MAFPPKKPCTGGSDVQTETESSHDIRGSGDVRGIALNPENEWVKLAKLIPWWAFKEKYAEQFSSDPFDPSMMTRFRQRLMPELLQEVNDVIIGRKKAEDVGKDSHDDDPPDAGGDCGEESFGEGSEEEPANEGTLILDATCVPQNIRFPTDASLLNEARESSEEIHRRVS